MDFLEFWGMKPVDLETFTADQLRKLADKTETRIRQQEKG